jgi:ATP-dependent Clp protease ATP-binding subunit ClpC
MVQKLLKISTEKVTEALQMALMESANQRKSILCAEAILIALIDQKDSIVTKIFNELDLDVAHYRNEIVDLAMSVISTLPDMDPKKSGQLQMSKEVENLFTEADKHKRRLGDNFISTGALFLAFFDKSVPSTAKLFERLDLKLEAVIAALDGIRGNRKISDRDSESKLKVLDEYTTDLTAMARRGELDPVIGRDLEIDRAIQILSRRKKNNPLLVGEPGVGKTVIAEGLANRIAEADVPDNLLNKRIVSLEMGSLVAGAKMQGEFEERLKRLRDEIIASEGQIILFIDEIHTVVGAGRSSGALDASNMLKPALARGQLQCIGATTNREYKQYIESDKALERRFQLVKVEEPSLEATIGILKGIKSKYEAFHQVKYDDDALVAAAELSKKYLQERSLPDKAIDLIDEAGSIKRLEAIYLPPELRKIERQRQDLFDKKAKAFAAQNFELMSQYQMALAQLDDEMKSRKEEINSANKSVQTIVDRETIAGLISKQTGVPAQKIMSAESEKLLNLEQYFKNRVIGQDHAVVSISNAIRRNRSGLRETSRPIASFLFLGPTGVGKTELAKAIAAELTGNEQNLIRIDMSEFMASHDVSKLIGSPPGYVGYGEGGQLTEKVRRQPYSVVLFDEFEKAHPDVFNLLLQILDEGFLTDAQGQRVSFANCIIIGTSNLGSDILAGPKKSIGIGAHLSEWNKDDQSKEVFKIVKGFLRPELINRIDEIIVFNRLRKEDLSKIVDMNMVDLKSRLKKLGYPLVVQR